MMFMINPNSNIPVTTLKSIADYVFALMHKTKSRGAILNDYLPSAFPNIHNNLLLSYELLTFYYGMLANVKKREMLRANDLDRIDAILTMVFIDSFSVIEYSTKELVKEKRFKVFSGINDQLATGKKIYFSTIMERSEEIGLIDKHQQDLLFHIRMFRNAKVHNAGVFDRAGTFEYIINSQSFTIEYKEGKQPLVPLLFPVQMLDILTEIYLNWVENFLKIKE
jgi:hypothetical protein